MPWISTDERLPTFGSTVECIIEDNGRRMDATCRLSGSTYAPKWTNNIRATVYVTHWYEQEEKTIAPSKPKVEVKVKAPDKTKSNGRVCQECGHGSEAEALAVIMVRLPKGLHRATKSEAHRRQVSMNQFCVEVLKKATTVPEE